MQLVENKRPVFEIGISRAKILRVHPYALLLTWRNYRGLVVAVVVGCKAKNPERLAVGNDSLSFFHTYI